MRVIPLPAFADNYIWLIECDGKFACIDPGDAAPVQAYLAARGAVLQQIWITHHHHDHTGGVAALQTAYPNVAVIGHSDIAGITQPVGEGSRWAFAGYEVEVWAVPGHTDSHVAYLWHVPDGLRVFCGDTLFSAGCGRVFTGTMAQLFASLNRLSALPDEALLYPAHEYTAANLRFAQHIEPDNAAVRQALHDSAIPSLPVRVAHERAVNPFLRVNEPAVRERAAALSGQPCLEPLAVFAALRELKNHF